MTDGVAQVLHNSLKAKANDLIAGLFELFRIAELPCSRLPRSLLCHAFGDKILLRVGAMKGHLFVQFAAKSVAAKKHTQLAKESACLTH